MANNIQQKWERLAQRRRKRSDGCGNIPFWLHGKAPLPVVLH